MSQLLLSLIVGFRQLAHQALEGDRYMRSAYLMVTQQIGRIIIELPGKCRSILNSLFDYAAAQITINGRIRHSLFDLLKCKANVNTIYTRPYLFSALRDMFPKNMINHKACKKLANQK